MGESKHLIVILRNLYNEQETTVRTEFEETEWFVIGKRQKQECLQSPCQIIHIRMAGLDKLTVEIEAVGNTSNLDMQMAPLCQLKVKTQKRRIFKNKNFIKNFDYNSKL